MNMTDNEIIKALEYLIKNFDGKAMEFATLCKALDLINRQTAEIERLQNESIGKCELAISMRSDHNLDVDCNYCIEQARAEAIEEFLESAKSKAHFSDDFGEACVSCNDLDNLAEERMGIRND